MKIKDLRLIWAQSRQGVIGFHGALPWHLPEDLAHFKELTVGHTVLMGRKTWESLPPRFRPLPQRHNLVLSHQKDYVAKGAVVFHDFDDIFKYKANLNNTLWVIGGAQLYAQTLPYATAVEVTQLAMDDVQGDAYAPLLDASEWHLVAQQDHQSTTGIAYSFESYRRKL